MKNYQVKYSVIKWTNQGFAIAGAKVQPDETHDFPALSIKQAKKIATEWGDEIEFRGSRWKSQPFGYTKSVYEEGIETKLTLRQLRDPL